MSWDGKPPTGRLHAVVAYHVRRLMAQQRWRTQSELCRVAHVNESALSSCLTGNRGWRLIEIERLADAFGVPPAELFTDPREEARSA